VLVDDIDDSIGR